MDNLVLGLTIKGIPLEAAKNLATAMRKIAPFNQTWVFNVPEHGYWVEVYAYIESLEMDVNLQVRTYADINPERPAAKPGHYTVFVKPTVNVNTEV